MSLLNRGGDQETMCLRYIYICIAIARRDFFFLKLEATTTCCACTPLIADQLPGLSDLPTSLSVNILVPMLSVNILIHLQRADQVGQVYRNAYDAV